MRRLAGSGWGAVAKTLRTAALSLVYSIAEYCTPVWCRSAHTRLIDSVLNDALRIVTGCLRPTPTDYLPVLAGIQPAELRRLGATLSLAYRASLDPDHILYELLTGSPDCRRERLKSRRSFVPAARKLLQDLTELDIVQLNGQTLNETRNTRSAHLISVLSFLGKALDQWGWACPDHHGSGSTACGLVLGVFSRSCTNVALFLHRIASVALQNKPRNTLF